MTTPPRLGSIGWCDLTTGMADDLRRFYEHVVGWTSEPLSMGDYADHVMQDESGTPVAGICHARGVNAGLPPVWLLYVVVPNLDDSLTRVTAEGGRVLAGVRDMGASGRYAVIADPSGAPVALFQAPASPA